MTIIAAYQDAGTYRSAAAICGTTPKTVKRVIERAQAGGARPVPKLRARNYEVVVDLVAQRVKKSAGRITAKRLLPAARTAGYEGSARNFRRLVAQAKKDWRAEHHRGRRPAIWSPGEHPVSYTHLRAHETDSYLVCRLLLEKKKKHNYIHP